MLPGLIRPGLREPFGYAPSASAGHPSGYNPVAPFRPSDLNACYPMPTWVAERIRDYPQRVVGNTLRDPLPIPFTAEETREALFDVLQASRQGNNRWCASVSAASVQIATQVLPILMSRNGGWLDVSGRVGHAVNLQCVLYKLPGKPIPRIHDRCAWTPPPQQRLYPASQIKTTFDGLAPERNTQSDAARRLRDPVRAAVTPSLGADLELSNVTITPEALKIPLYELVASFDIHG